MKNNFYVYCYYREDGTPFYIGKGTKNRINANHEKFKLPTIERRSILIGGLFESEAFYWEMHYIKLYGRINDGSGILLNLTEGGEGKTGYRHRVESKEKTSNTMKGNTNRRGTSTSPEAKMRMKESKQLWASRLSVDDRQKMRERALGNTNCIGKKYTEEEKANRKPRKDIGMKRAAYNLNATGKVRKVRKTETKLRPKIKPESIQKRTLTRAINNERNVRTFMQL